jgi:hypothetical protein
MVSLEHFGNHGRDKTHPIKCSLSIPKTNTRPIRNGRAGQTF